MKQTFKIIFRSMLKKPILTLVSFTGFTIGIMASLLIYLWVYNQLNFDKFHSDYNQIYRVLTLSKAGEDIVKSSRSYQPIAESLKKDYPQIEAATFLMSSSEDAPLYVDNKNRKIEARKCYTNKDFFDIFNGFTFIEGNKESAFKNKFNIVLSERIAHKLFGSESALGKKVISDKYDEIIYTVGAVLKVPSNSHISFDFLVSKQLLSTSHYLNLWGDSYWIRTYIKLGKNALIDDSFLAKVSNHISRYSNKTDKLLFQPIADIHLHSDYTPNILDQHISSYKYVLIFSGLALLILIMVILNFSILSTARYSEQAQEIGIQKVNGAKRIHLLIQFMSNSLIQTFIAAILAIVLSWIFMPQFNQLTGQNLHFHLSSKLLLNLLVLTFFTAFVGGLYPSLYLSSLRPTLILNKQNITGNKSGLLKLLIVIQFSIAIFSFISSGILIKQFYFINSKDLGLSHNNMLVVPTGLWYDSEAFKNELLQNPNITSVSASTYAPIEYSWKKTYLLNNNGFQDSLRVSVIHTDENFADNYQLEMTKGNFLKMDYEAYWKEHKKEKNTEKQEKLSFPIVINETAEKLFGYDDPIGQRIGDEVIVGVVKDFHFKPLHHRIEPLVLMNSPENIMTMNIKISGYQQLETINYIKETYQKHRDNRNFSYQYFDDILQSKYEDEIHLKNTTEVFSLLALLVSLLGILGIASFVIHQRTKEIGVRKVNGAKTWQIINMFNKDLLKWIILSFVIACPIAWYVMNKWLENFAYKTEISWWVFALSGIITIAIASLTISLQSWRAAKRNPVESLRYE